MHLYLLTINLHILRKSMLLPQTCVESAVKPQLINYKYIRRSSVAYRACVGGAEIARPDNAAPE